MRKAIFWDFDGTLTVPHHMWSVSLLKALGPLAEEYGITWEKIRPFTHSGFPWDEDGAGHLTGQAWWDCMLEKFSHAYLHFGIPKAKAGEAACRVKELILSRDSYRVYPDAAAVLAVCLYKGYKNYLLSNNYPELEEVLARLQLRQFFSGCIVSGKVGVNKPHPEIFRLGEEVANFPSQIWMVGDNPVADIAGAKGAGWKTALVHGAEGSGADVTAETLTDLLKYL